MSLILYGSNFCHYSKSAENLLEKFNCNKLMDNKNIMTMINNKNDIFKNYNILNYEYFKNYKTLPMIFFKKDNDILFLGGFDNLNLFINEINKNKNNIIFKKSNIVVDFINYIIKFL